MGCWDKGPHMLVSCGLSLIDDDKQGEVGDVFHKGQLSIYEFLGMFIIYPLQGIEELSEDIMIPNKSGGHL